MHPNEGVAAGPTWDGDPPFEVKAYGPDPGRFRIGLAPIAPERWFEPAAGDPRPRKAALLEAVPETVWGEAAGSRPGQLEALKLVAASRGIQACEVDGEAPLLTAAFLVEDDLCLMERATRGWTLTAASLSSASFFTPRETVGLALHDLHRPVPGFPDHLLLRVERIFDRLPSAQILERRNWSVVNSGELSLPEAGAVRGRIKDIACERASEALFIRSERQTIRRLPHTGGILFTIRICRETLKSVLADRSRADAFRAVWSAAMQASDPSVRDYKILTLYEPLIRPLL